MQSDLPELYSVALQGLKHLLAAVRSWLPGVHLVVTLRQANAAAMPPGPTRVECVQPLTNLQAEQLLLKLVPIVRYPELMGLATACGCVPLTLHTVAGAMKKQKLTTQVLPCPVQWTHTCGLGLLTSAIWLLMYV